MGGCEHRALWLRPSFGVKVSDSNGMPYYHCFTCGQSGPLPKLQWQISQLTGNRFPEASDILSRNCLFSDDGDAEPRKRKRIILFDKYVNLKRETKKNLPVPMDILEKYPLLAEKSGLAMQADALSWLHDVRKISLQSVAKYKLRLFQSIIDEVGVIFPILALDGETVLDMWVRLIDSKKFFRLTPSLSNSPVNYGAPNLFFGNHLFDQTKPILLVEGALDALRLDTLGVARAMAAFGYPSVEQFNSLYSTAVFLGFDSDNAGREFTKRALRQLKCPAISILDWAIVKKKDPGELESKNEFLQVFNERIKIISASPNREKRRKVKKSRNRNKFLNDDGTFL